MQQPLAIWLPTCFGVRYSALHCILLSGLVPPRKGIGTYFFSSPPGAENPRYATDSRQWRTTCYSDGFEGPHRCRRTHRIHHVAPVSTPFPDDYWLLWPMHASLPHCHTASRSVQSFLQPTKPKHAQEQAHLSTTVAVGGVA